MDFFKKRWFSRSNPHMSGALKNLPGTPRDFQFKDLEKATNKFDEKMKLGQGGYGVVYKGYLAKEDLTVAVKIFSRESLKSQGDFLSELIIINQLRHKHLLRLLGWCHEHGKLLLVYEYMPNGSLDKHLFWVTDSNTLSWILRYKIISEVASALHYLHNGCDQRVVHCDIKASNIMLNSEFNARLGDLGLARALNKEKTSYKEAKGVSGTPGYIAPECFITGEATELSDVYAFGAVLLEVVCGRRLWTKNGMYKFLVDWVRALHRKGRLLEAVDNRLGEDYVVEEAQRVLLLGLACSHPTASERPKTQEIVQILSGSMAVPHVLLMREGDISPSTTIDTMSDTTSHNGSGSTPLAINPEMHESQETVQILSGTVAMPLVLPFKPAFVLASMSMGEGDISQPTTTNTASCMTSHYGSGWTPFAINPETQQPYSDFFPSRSK